MMAVLDALEHYGFIKGYVVDAKRYGFIPSFSEHQTFHKTERASTLPPPLPNGGSTVNDTSDTVTGTGAGTQLDVDDLGAVPPEPELTALFLAICANRAITERWGEQPNPLTPASAVSLTEALRNAGVEGLTARLSIYRQCRTLPSKVPPRSVNYFRKGIEQDWESEKTRRALAVSGEVPPSPDATKKTTKPVLESWSAARDRKESEEGQRALVANRWGSVEQRRLKPDGQRWWARMQAEAKSADANAVLYAFDRMTEPAEVNRASA